MKILIIGSGSREHALGWHLAQEARVKKLYFAPGNAGTAALGKNLPISAVDVPALVEWATKERPHLTLVGPEAPLCAGVVDAFEAEGLAIFGPNQQAAQLEASKVFTKELLLRHGIPTGAARIFTNALDAYAYSQQQPYPQVLKADGLAAGKGVIIANTPEEAARGIYKIMEARAFGQAGARLLIEECLVGQEISILAITDGRHYQVLPPAQDHKRLLEGDRGPNTGGMGAYAPAPFYTPELAGRIDREIIEPSLEALRKEGIDFRGVLFIGLMLTQEGPKVLEFNVRLGDPEAQVVMPLLKTSWIDIAEAVRTQTLDQVRFQFKASHALGVVLAAENYPESPRVGDAIQGLPAAGKLPHVAVFHGGTKLGDSKKPLTSGGRVLTVTAWAPSLEQARERAYYAAELISFEGQQFRTDIGAKALS